MSEVTKTNRKRRTFQIYASTYRLIVTALIVGAAIMTACFVEGSARRYRDLASKGEVTYFRNFAVKTLEGDNFSTTDLAKNRLTVVNVWATFCGPCVEEMPTLEEISKELEGEEIQLIGICNDAVMNDGTLNDKLFDEQLRLMQKTGVTYTQLIPDLTMKEQLLIPAVTGHPTTFFVDSSGKVVDIQTGPRDKQRWLDTIHAALQKTQ